MGGPKGYFIHMGEPKGYFIHMGGPKGSYNNTHLFNESY